MNSKRKIIGKKLFVRRSRKNWKQLKLLVSAIAVEGQKITTNPAKVVKLIPLIKFPPRQISDGEESAIVSAVTNYGFKRDRTIIVLMFHTGLRAAEVCQLRCEYIRTLAKV